VVAPDRVLRRLRERDFALLFTGIGGALLTLELLVPGPRA
jgi:hypothetical protein